ncbi:uroporphyrinogen-III synthase [Pseudomonas synxantha]|uniref:Uroporphyrinogen-III synthase n=1 Tax=Pseudomonas synxantha TaxID=47883 RepID=A0AAX3IGG8_9PSED|nr:uroporphyrinogen-III synthase [Pseudomonas synxantha]AZE70025.1 Uroporphyrinogen-III synthase [Pseudomonas synxantha]KRP55502.1 uroporphyrinogen-III synthase [Pseudomonas synxantha]MBI6562713.1 uroporphyrinogen-III synthase [Pseudomonas synxantha]SDU64412.1 uroporphyrinogen-III synthase [Pseudomonas synxantha]VTR05946.1 uroporphyrinogen-III synthase [Pseudomonas synxantha]
MTDWRVLLTRPAEDSMALGALLSEAGIYSSSLPLLETEALPVTPEQQALFGALQRYCAIIVVSKPAARLALQRLKSTPAPMPWFSVGAATAQILADHGLDVHYPATGDDSEALLQLPALREATARPGARVLILRGEGGRELLAERLREQGASVDYLELYRRFLPAYETGTLMQRIQLERLNGLVVSSGQGFLHLQAMAGPDWPEVAQLPLFVPSPRVYEIARAAGAEKVVDCRGASAAALLVALGSYPVPTL